MTQTMMTGQSDLSNALLGERHAQRSSEPAHERATILVIDDEASIAQMLSQALDDAGYQVLTASDGRKGLSLSKLLRPELVLTDYMMPGLNGAQLVRKMRQFAATRHIPAVLMSCARPAADELGGVSFLAKPFDLDEVLETIARALDSQKADVAH